MTSNEVSVGFRNKFHPIRICEPRCFHQPQTSILLSFFAMDDTSNSDSLSSSLFGSSSDSESGQEQPEEIASPQVCPLVQSDDDSTHEAVNTGPPIPESVNEVESEEEEEADEDDTECFEGSWKFQKLSARDRFHIDTKGTDPYLLSVFQAEATQIRSNIKSEAADQPSSDLSAVVNIFVQPLVPVLLRAANSQLQPVATPFAKEDVYHFIRVLAWLSVYRMTPASFFNSEMANRMRLPSENFSEFRFKNFLNALSKNTNRNSEKEWNQPFEEDRYIREMEAAIAEVSC